MRGALDATVWPEKKKREERTRRKWEKESHAQVIQLLG